MTDASQPVKTFISYAWTSDAHKERVRGLADQLIGSGIDVILDQYHLREGDDANAFMEQVAARGDVGKVIAVCDPKYVSRMNSRQGGSGQEGMIMSPHVYEQLRGTLGEGSLGRERHFIAVIFDRDPELPRDDPRHLPTMFGSSKYIDMSTPADYDRNFDVLLRFLLDKPELVPPPLGKIPSHLLDDAPNPLPSGAQAANLRRAIENDRRVEPALRDYLNEVKAALHALEPMVDGNGQLSIEKGVTEAQRFTRVRDEFVDLTRHVVRHGHWHDDIYTEFFESLISIEEEASQRRFVEIFFAHLELLRLELFLYTAATLISAKATVALAGLTDHTYFRQVHGDAVPVGYGIFRHLHAEQQVGQLYNQFAQQNWRSPLGAWLFERATLHSVTRDDLRHADLLLFIKAAVQRRYGASTGLLWNPVTGPYWENTDRVPMFRRFLSRKQVQPWLSFFGAASVDELRTRLKEAFPDRLYGKYVGGSFSDFDAGHHLSLNELGSLN